MEGGEMTAFGRARGRWLGCAGVGGFMMLAGAGTAVASPPICGPLHGPTGTLAGTYNSNVIVEGKCVVDAGPALVRGNIIVKPGGHLEADFALDHRNPESTVGSRLTVNGDVRVQSRATLILGCDPQSSPCADDPALKMPEEPPTLSSHSQIFGLLASREAKIVIVHNAHISGNVSQAGGGGGFNCRPEGHESFSAYEDSTINGNVTISGVASCWLGLARLKVHGNVTLKNNQLADPDAIEVLANTILGNLSCHENSMVWDSAEKGFPGLFPRVPLPNKVNGSRSGQCVLASPETEGGPPGPGPF
jgi:hypothetical protein